MSIILVGLLFPLLDLIPARIVKTLIDAVQDENRTVTMAFLFTRILLPYILTMLAIYLVSTTKRVLQNRMKIKLYYALQVRYMENILVQDASFFERFQSGDLLTRALGDVKSVNFSGGNRLLNIFLEFMTVVVTLVAMILIEPVLAILCFIPLSFIFLTNLVLKRKVKRNWQLVREKSSQMGNVILESITKVRKRPILKLMSFFSRCFNPSSR